MKNKSLFHVFTNGLLNENFGTRIDGARGLIQDEHRGTSEHGAGDSQKLFLALGDVVCLLVELHIISTGQGTDEVIDMRFFGGGDHLFLGGIWRAVGNIIANSAAE